MKLLLTAFDPFGGEALNPAQLALQKLQPPPGVTLRKLIVPTVFGDSVEAVKTAARDFLPDVIVSIGQAGGRSCVTPERVAINFMDATIPDNKGYIPREQPVVAGGETAFFSTLPIKSMVKAIQDAGVPAAVSNTAGTFVCNQLMYGVLKLCQEQYPDTDAGFIHVPFLPQQAELHPGTPSLTLSQIVTALQAAINCLAEEYKGGN